MKNALIGKAHGITTAIDKMNGHQRQRMPSVDFGEDYNRLRAATAKEFPDLEPLLPPPVKKSHDFDGTDSTYAELRTFAEQIYQMLATDDG